MDDWKLLLEWTGRRAALDAGKLAQQGWEDFEEK
jgi:hypothetical protein